jgi:hypothetical protein
LQRTCNARQTLDNRPTTAIASSFRRRHAGEFAAHGTLKRAMAKMTIAPLIMVITGEVRHCPPRSPPENHFGRRTAFIDEEIGDIRTCGDASATAACSAPTAVRPRRPARDVRAQTASQIDYTGIDAATASRLPARRAGLRFRRENYSDDTPAKASHELIPFPEYGKVRSAKVTIADRHRPGPVLCSPTEAGMLPACVMRASVTRRTSATKNDENSLVSELIGSPRRCGSRELARTGVLPA